MPLDWVKQTTSCSQLIGWMEFLDWKINAFDKQDYYLAQIAQKIENLIQLQYKVPKFVKLKDMLIKFMFKPKLETGEIESPTKTAQFKQFFFGLTGLTGKGRKT